MIYENMAISDIPSIRITHSHCCSHLNNMPLTISHITRGFFEQFLIKSWILDIFHFWSLLKWWKKLANDNIFFCNVPWLVPWLQVFWYPAIHCSQAQVLIIVIVNSYMYNSFYSPQLTKQIYIFLLSIFYLYHVIWPFVFKKKTNELSMYNLLLFSWFHFCFPFSSPLAFTNAFTDKVFFFNVCHVWFVLRTLEDWKPTLTNKRCVGDTKCESFMVILRVSYAQKENVRRIQHGWRGERGSKCSSNLVWKYSSKKNWRDRGSTKLFSRLYRESFRGARGEA